MKHLALATALLAVADMVFRHGAGMRAVMAAATAFGQGIGAWVFYPA